MKARVRELQSANLFQPFLVTTTCIQLNMRRNYLWLTGLFFCAAVVLAQSLPPTIPHINNKGAYYSALPRRPELVRRTSEVRGKHYLSLLETSDGSPDWESTQPLPIALSDAEKAARIELGKVVSDASEWIVTDFQISRFSAGPGWYYAVTLKPILQLTGEHPEAFTLLLDFSGKPGRVRQLGQVEFQR